MLRLKEHGSRVVSNWGIDQKVDSDHRPVVVDGCHEAQALPVEAASAKLWSITNGCLIQSIPAEPGQRFAIREV